MKHIDEARIEELLRRGTGTDEATLERILARSRTLARLSLEETAALLAVTDPRQTAKIFETAAFVKDAIYGRRVVLFAPLYISNRCSNACRYCAFQTTNAALTRRSLSVDEVRQQTELLLKRGHKRVLMVAGEDATADTGIDYCVESVKAIYAAAVGQHRIKRVNVNCAPLSVENYRKLKASGIGTYQIFQETYHEATYRYMHPSGPKSDPDNRIDAVERAFAAGIDDVGIGVLYGLYDWRFDTLALLMHIEALEKKYGFGPHTISVPRIEPAVGIEDFTTKLQHALSDDEFKKVVAILRLAVPYTGIILSTRESAQLRDQLFSLGISQISAGSRTAPGGYSCDDNNTGTDTQFTLGDQRPLNEVMETLIDQNILPSFCAACYRANRTGETFMNLARPGTIKGKCSINALVTLKEYLDDFASPEVRRKGYLLIDDARAKLSEDDRKQLARFFEDIDNGLRDRFV